MKNLKPISFEILSVLLMAVGIILVFNFVQDCNLKAITSMCLGVIYTRVVDSRFYKTLTGKS
jgi:hypothetical protein